MVEPLPATTCYFVRFSNINKRNKPVDLDPSGCVDAGELPADSTIITMKHIVTQSNYVADALTIKDMEKALEDLGKLNIISEIRTANPRVIINLFSEENPIRVVDSVWGIPLVLDPSVKRGHVKYVFSDGHTETCDLTS